MEHYRLRKYRGPEVWARVRAAYEAGESGPSVARRLDVGLTNLRKKCRLEGWSRRHQAERLDRELAGERIAPDLQTAGAADGPVDRQAALAACIDHAAAAMARGDGQKALAALRAAQAFTKVSRWLDEDPPEEPTAPGRRAAIEYLRHLRAVHTEAAELARRMMAETCDGMAAGSDMVLHWRAENLGPEVAARDYALAVAEGRERYHWDEDGVLRPLDRRGMNAVMARAE